MHRFNVVAASRQTNRLQPGRDAVVKYCWLLAGKSQEGGSRQLKQVSVMAAFDSPDVLQECTSSLRDMVAEYGSDAACAVVPKASIAYPQVSARGRV